MDTIGELFTLMCNSKNYEVSLPIVDAIIDLMEENILTRDTTLTTSALHTIHEKTRCNAVGANSSISPSLNFLEEFITEKAGVVASIAP